MKSSAIVLGVVFALAAGSANAAVIYDTIGAGTARNAGSNVIAYGAGYNGGGGPIAESFYSGSAVTLTSVSLELSAAAQDDNMTSIYLVADTGTGGTGIAASPTYTGSGAALAFTNSVLLGTISNLTLGTSPTTKTLSISQAITAGEYWIAAVTGGSTQWWYAGNGTGIGTAGQAGFDLSGGDGYNQAEVFSVDAGGYEMTVTTASAAVPEPAGLAILGVALAGLGVVRRRRKTV